ncbi:unnamed protein product [Didymodactylos carnosus]|uniref:Peptidase S1 domain-containing protein n=1 Tax=Didymodactylos carnosus TaxID=1234261 RepID=A0A814SDR8_9BILA|nr:unnamed protein product [Didymodactylos carnosus]CAF1146693.1 unnamed protein product [Didymodactylos carnosus]CAF3711726.1 unnamed protein product [Didymodactylos carnosus]CAF3910263.1 unnamed protein product [Didymodactylos carnosus]
MKAAKSAWELYPHLSNKSLTDRNRPVIIRKRKSPPRRIHGGAPKRSRPFMEKLNKRGLMAYTTGKVFWSEGNGWYGECSGSVTKSDNADLIITAAHCVYDDTTGFRTDKNWVFVPQYTNGNAPFGIWPARYQTILASYSENKDYNDDVGMVLLSTVNGQHIQDVVGSQNVAFNLPRDTIIYSFGYPKNLANGETLQYCSGQALDSVWGNGYIGQTIPCLMGGGCSGGPWLQDYNPDTGIGYQVSVNSFQISNIPNYMNGPYFDDDISDLYDGVTNKT